MKPFIRVFFLLIVLVTLGSFSWACSCAASSVEGKLQNSDLVFHGSVDSKVVNGNLMENVFSVQTAYKGELGDFVSIFTASSPVGSLCGIGFETGYDYLIYARVVDGKYTASLCSGIQSGEAIGTETAQLSEIVFPISKGNYYTYASCTEIETGKTVYHVQRIDDTVLDRYFSTDGAYPLGQLLNVENCQSVTRKAYESALAGESSQPSYTRPTEIIPAENPLPAPTPTIDNLLIPVENPTNPNEENIIDSPAQPEPTNTVDNPLAEPKNESNPIAPEKPVESVKSNPISTFFVSIWNSIRAMFRI